MKKIVSILVMIMLACTGLTLIFDNDFNVRGIPGGNGEESFDSFLDYAWFNITSNLSYVVHNDSIWGEGDEVIRKGRSFGTPGDAWTAEYINTSLSELGLSNVQLIKLGPIAGKLLWEYTSKVETIDFNLTCNSEDWPSIFSNDGHIPKNETFTFPSAKGNKTLEMTYNNSFNNIILIPKDYSENWYEKGLNTNNHLNISYNEINVLNNVTGNATYIPANTSQLPDDQDGRIFLIVEEEGCENQLDNVTNASAVLLIHDNTKGAGAYNADYDFENYTISTGRANITNDNLSTVIQMLENGTMMIIDNFENNQTMTFIYDFTYLFSWWPTEDFFIIGGWNASLGDFYNLTGFTWVANYFFNVLSRGWCHGFIVYENYLYDVHNMDSTSRRWIGWANTPINQVLGYISVPWLQMFCINRTIGEWLEDHSDDPDCKMSGYLEQEYIEENYANMTAGVDAYNVEGNITIDQSPNDAVIIISNRYDGWFGECPGDSGAGAGIVMGIAKYIKEKNIKPKYNLTFLFTTGEEYGYRGAWHYSHSHPKDEFNIIRWIGVDQVGFSNTTDETKGQVLNSSCKNSIDELIFDVIANDSDYDDRTNNSHDSVHAEMGPGHTDDVAWMAREDCDTIVVFKGGSWVRHHRAGLNYVEGDSMKFIDRNDLNVTFELFWNLTKYYTVNPDCWIDNYSATAFDSTSDNGTLKDSVNITFSLKTILPNDNIRAKAELKKTFSNDIVDNCSIDYYINSTDGVQDSIILTVPENASAGFYTCRFYLYNSTGRINDIVDIGLPCSRYNDSRWKLFYLHGFNDSTISPYFYDVGCASQSIGYGSSNTISGSVSSTVNSTISQSQTYVLYPDDSFDGYNMTNYEENIYELEFENTWQNGEHLYCVWAIDENGNSSASDWYSFNVSIEANIGVCTLLDEYGNDKYINITDPPNPPENYMLVDRGLTWNKFYDAVSGNNVLETYTSPMNYQEGNGSWIPINCSLGQLATNHPAYNYGYRVGNEQGLYNVYFKPNTQFNWPVAFAYNKSDDPTTYVVRSKLVGVGYLDPVSDWAYEFLQNVQSSQGQFTNDEITYEDVFTGTDVTWSYENMELKEKITLSNTTKLLLQSHPPSLYGLQNDSSYLVFITKMDYQGLILYNDTGNLNGNVTISDGWVGFKDPVSGNIRCVLPIGDAYELYNDSVREKLVYRFLQHNDDYYLLSGLKVEDLNNMVFPVVVDPTLSVFSSQSDGYIYNSSSNYSTAWSSVDGVVSDGDSYISVGQSKVSSFPPDYRIRRGFLFFDTSELPSNAYIENATLSLYKYSDYSTTDFVITVQDGQPDYPHDPLAEGDYNKSCYSGDGGGLDTIDFVNGTNNITLTELGWINISGRTMFCLRSSRDINGAMPTGNEYVNVYSANAPDVPDSYLPKLTISYRNQSKIKNTGSTNISGYLLMQVQYKEGEEWVVDNDAVNESSPRVIGVDEQLALDTIFNGLVNTNDLCHGSGVYRVYAAFRNPDGDVLVCDDDSLLEASYEFSVDI